MSDLVNMMKFDPHNVLQDLGRGSGIRQSTDTRGAGYVTRQTCI